MKEGGAIAARIPVETHAYACMLAGPQRRTLFLATGATHDPAVARKRRSGPIEIVDAAGAGLP